MSQSPIDLKDGSGSAVLVALNALFLSLATLQSGAQAPEQPLAFMLWADTENHLLNIRNSTNDAWITLGELDSTGLFLGNGAITSAKLADQAVSLSKIERGPAGTVLAVSANGTQLAWESREDAKQNQDPVLTARGEGQDPTWIPLPQDTFDGWQVGDTIHITMPSCYFGHETDTEISGKASADVTITSVSRETFYFSGQCRMDLYDPDVVFDDHYAHSGVCTGYVQSNYFACIDANGSVEFDPLQTVNWDTYGYVTIYRR